MAILIVDDEPDMRQSLQFLLEAHGYSDVIQARNGLAALEVLATTPGVELIVADVTMPGLNGLDLCRKVKAVPALHDIPILVLTGRATEDILERAFAAGAHDFLPKGLGPTELLARVRAALRLKRELDQRRVRERELERLAAKLRRLSARDGLTGVPNRRAFARRLRREWARAARDGAPLALVMADVDLFKGFNDRYGHPAGDGCLARVASTLTGLVRRPGDLVARYGGEEFAALLAGTGEHGAATVAESMRRAVEGLGLEHAGSAHGRVTVSLGVAACVPEPGGSAATLVEAADRALYRAKAGGRNRVEVDSGEQCGVSGPALTTSNG